MHPEALRATVAPLWAFLAPATDWCFTALLRRFRAFPESWNHKCKCYFLQSNRVFVKDILNLLVRFFKLECLSCPNSTDLRHCCRSGNRAERHSKSTNGSENHRFCQFKTFQSKNSNWAEAPCQDDRLAGLRLNIVNSSGNRRLTIRHVFRVRGGVRGRVRRTRRPWE